MMRAACLPAVGLVAFILCLTDGGDGGGGLARYAGGTTAIVSIRPSVLVGYRGFVTVRNTARKQVRAFQTSRVVATFARR